MSGVIYKISVKPGLRHAFGLFISILGPACASTEKTQSPEAPLEPTHYVLEVGTIQEEVAPLPNSWPIFAKYYRGETLLETRKAFMAWDFNRDGAFDMLEVLGSDGEVERRAYDWNRDGLVDAVNLVRLPTVAAP